MTEDPFRVERDNPLDLSGLTPEVVRNWVQLQKIIGNVTPEVRAMVRLLASYDEQKTLASLWENEARKLGYGMPEDDDNTPLHYRALLAGARGELEALRLNLERYEKLVEDMGDKLLALEAAKESWKQEAEDLARRLSELAG